MSHPRVTGSLRPDDFILLIDRAGELSAHRVEGWELSVRAGEIRPVYDGGRTLRDLGVYTQVRLVSRETDPSVYMYELGERMLGSRPDEDSTDEGTTRNGEARDPDVPEAPVRRHAEHEARNR